MLCGGITLYSPLKNHGCGPGKKVGIIGVGGLGHFGVLFAKALGADKVVGISRKADKRDDVLKMGADEYVATSEDKDVSTALLCLRIVEECLRVSMSSGSSTTTAPLT